MGSKTERSKAESDAKQVGHFDPKRHLTAVANGLMKDNIVHELRSMIDVTAFQ